MLSELANAITLSVSKYKPKLKSERETIVRARNVDVRIGYYSFDYERPLHIRTRYWTLKQFTEINSLIKEFKEFQKVAKFISNNFLADPNVSKKKFESTTKGFLEGTFCREIIMKQTNSVNSDLTGIIETFIEDYERDESTLTPVSPDL